MNEEVKQALLPIPIEPEIKKTFKTICSNNGRSMSAVIREYIGEYIRHNQGKSA